MNNIEMKTTTFKKPVGVQIMVDCMVARTLEDVKTITEEFDREGNALATFFDCNGKYLDSICLIRNWSYFIFKGA